MADANLFRKRAAGTSLPSRRAALGTRSSPGAQLPALDTETEALVNAIADEAAARAAERQRALAAGREPRWRGELPPGVPGYLVARKENGRFTGTTHTTPMDLEGAQQEARKHSRLPGVEWVAVEVREVPR